MNELAQTTITEAQTRLIIHEVGYLIIAWGMNVCRRPLRKKVRERNEKK
jgi:hypothetical protein